MQPVCNKELIIMTDKKSIQILVFSFAVFMVLLRPYAAYQISKHAGFASDPVKVYDLLQRLIKKRDEHHIIEQSAFTAVRQSKPAPVLPGTYIPGLYKPSLLSLTGPKSYLQGNTIFRSYPGNKYYKLLSKFQI
jgi:hypothetical protein